MSSTDRGRMRPGRRSAVALAAVAALTGCGGAPIALGPDGSRFGQAVATNIAVQSGRGGSPEATARLAAAFAAEAPETVRFAFDSAALDASAAEALARQARWLREHPDAAVEIEGHADLVGGESYNARLGLRRAGAVADRLAALGVDPARLRMVETRGETAPVVPVEAREPLNRRAVTRVVAAGGPRAAGPDLDGTRALLAYTEYQRDTTEEVRNEAAAEVED